jgi:hypothetical protein
MVRDPKQKQVLPSPQQKPCQTEEMGSYQSETRAAPAQILERRGVSAKSLGEFTTSGGCILA